MCKSIDVAVAMLNKSIDYAFEYNEPKYYMDYVKLHKLLYLGQCYILSRYGLRLFEEDITAHNCGPYVDGIGTIPANYGFGVIKEKIQGDNSKGIIYLPLTFSRDETVNEILKEFGMCTTDEVVRITKETIPFKGKEGMFDNHPSISKEQLIEAGKDLFVQK
ncbi:MAG: DUF4065 domain-containing protein [Oscillospiraceae bacterium]|nr:DUF4065 domain-containing protein [Oscillospiraceae bacterium]